MNERMKLALEQGDRRTWAAMDERFHQCGKVRIRIEILRLLERHQLGHL